MHIALSTLGINCNSLQVLGNYVDKIENTMLKMLRSRKAKSANSKSLLSHSSDLMIVTAFDEVAEEGGSFLRPVFMGSHNSWKI